jgi:hypothetical protein
MVLTPTVFPDLPVRSEAVIEKYFKNSPQVPVAQPDDASFALGPAAAPPVPPLYKLLKGNLRFRIESDSDVAIARASLDGAGNMAFQYLGDENGPQSVVAGFYTVDDNDCGIAGTLTFHFHKPTGNTILSDYTFYGTADGSQLWFKHLEMGTKVTGEASLLS